MQNKVFKKWVDYLLTTIACVSLTLACMNSTENIFYYIISQLILIFIGGCSTMLLNKFSRDYR